MDDRRKSAFVAEEMEILTGDILLTAVLASIGVLLLFLVVYRSLQDAVLVFLPLLAGMAVCLGFTVLAFGG